GAKYMVKRRGPPGQGWLTFLRNHAPEIAAMYLFVVPTIGFDLLYAFVLIRLDRRELVPRHSDYDWLILSQFRMGRSFGSTRIWMLRATPGWRRMRPFRSSVTIIWWTEGGLT